MGRISPLDQLISSSAFNDCSVTVIYSGVIITDVLLLCDGPSAPWPSLFCADVIVFFGTTPASLPVVLCIYVVPSSAQRTFASVAWLWETSHGVSGPRGLSNLTWETIAYSPPDQSQRSLLEPEKKHAYLQLFMLLLCIKMAQSSTLYYQMCIHVWMWWVCMCPTRPTWNEKCYVCIWECVRIHFEFQCFLSCWYKLGTALSWSLWLSEPYFFLIGIKKLEVSPETRIWMASCILLQPHLSNS